MKEQGLSAVEGIGERAAQEQFAAIDGGEDVGSVGGLERTSR